MFNNYPFWFVLPDSVRVLLLIMGVVAAISLVRVARLAWRLYRPLGPHFVRSGTVATDPEELARIALTGIDASKSWLAAYSGAGSATEAAHDTMGLAEQRFRYYWDECASNVNSIKRAGVVILLLSILGILYGLAPFYESWFPDNRASVSFRLVVMVDRVLQVLGDGVALFTASYLISGAAQRVLENRKRRWEYFCSRVKLDRRQPAQPPNSKES